MAKSATPYRIGGLACAVEVDLAPGLPKVVTVGLPDTAVRESQDRVRAALRNAGYLLPIQRVTVNLAPADVKKEGPAFDLPIAIGRHPRFGWKSHKLPAAQAIAVGAFCLPILLPRWTRITRRWQGGLALLS